MPSTCNRARLFASATLFAITACSSGQVNLPAKGSDNPASQTANAHFGSDAPADTTSILKKLTKDVVIGSTIDPSNGDKAPRAISLASGSRGLLQKGQLLVCNFDDKAGTAGAGTTMELLDPKPHSKPTRFVQSVAIEGCDGDAITHSFDIFGSGLTSHDVVDFNAEAQAVRTYSGSPFKLPLSDAFAFALGPYEPSYVFASDAARGSIISISEGFYGDGKALEVADGFAADKSKSGGELGPSGLRYNQASDTLYIVDAVSNTVVAFEHASDLLVRDEIVVEPGGKTFKCKHKPVTCGKLIYAGSPLNAPMFSALLPNGNLIVANTGGRANTLVELTPAGQILDTKVVDKNSTQGVFGLMATGTDDSDTALFFTDTNANDVQELKQ